MVRKWIIACVMLLSAGAAHAIGGVRMVEFGLKTGVSTRDVRIGKTENDRYSLSVDSRLGFHIGLMGRVNLATFHIQPEIIYSTSTYKLDASSASEPGSHAKVRLNTWDFPIMFGVKFLFFRAQAGPVFNMSTDNTIKPGSGTVPHVLFSRSTVGYAAGIGFDIQKVNIDVRYNGQFKRAVQSIGIGNETSREVKTRLNNWMFSIGYMF